MGLGSLGSIEANETRNIEAHSTAVHHILAERHVVFDLVVVSRLLDWLNCLPLRVQNNSPDLRSPMNSTNSFATPCRVVDYEQQK